MNYTLQCTYPEILSSICIVVQTEMKSNFLTIQFNVQNASEHNVNPRFSNNVSTSGLWDYDVVEAFISIVDPNHRNLSHYFEFQVSPLSQYFEIEIFKPRIDFNHNFKSNFVFKSEMFAENWQTVMGIPLSSVGHESSFEIWGNFFACLGKDSNRTFWSSFLPKQVKPDFHLPQYFRKLF